MHRAAKMVQVFRLGQPSLLARRLARGPTFRRLAAMPLLGFVAVVRGEFNLAELAFWLFGSDADQGGSLLAKTRQEGDYEPE